MIAVVRHRPPRLSPTRAQFSYKLAFVSPWLIGFVWFFLYPTVASLYYGFTSYNVLQPPTWVGLSNYIETTQDSRFWNSLSNTVYYTLLSVPLNILVAFTLALVLNQAIPGPRRAAYPGVHPSRLPITATAMIWMWMFNTNWGMLNNLLALDRHPRAGLAGQPTVGQALAHLSCRLGW